MGLQAAAPAPRLFVNSQQRVRIFLPPAASGRRQFFCCANPQQESHEEARLRVEISPSVLGALQPQDPSSSPAPPGESLIERNLRKRAVAKQEQSSSALCLGDGLLTPPEEQGSSASFTPQPASASLSAEQGFLPGHGESEDYSRYAMSNPCPISTVFWQESPPGFSMENFHGLEFYAAYFCLSLLSSCSPEYILELSDLLAMRLTSNRFLENGEKFLPRWTKDVAETLVKFTEDFTILQVALPLFGTFWSRKSWTKRVESGKARALALVSILTASVYVLSGTAPDLKEKLEEKSASLKEAVTELHGSVLDPVGIWEKALKGTSFSLDGNVHAYDYSLIFPCTAPSSEGRLEFGSMLEEVQECLDREFQGLDLVALLHRSSDSQEKFFILIAPWYWILAIESQLFARVAGVSALLACLATSQFASAGLGLGFAWEQYGVPLGLAGIIASTFNISFPVLCPFPSLGAIRKISFNYGNLPSRESLITAILKTNCAPLAVSLLLLACGFTFWGPAQFTAASVKDFAGYILIPPDIFAYSGLLTKLLQTVSVAMVQAEDGTPRLAASPFTLAGLLGLNFTAFSLFPGLQTDGSYLLRSLLRSKKLASEVTYVCTVMLTLSLCARNPFLGLGWLFVSFMSGAQLFVKDDVSDPDLLTSVAGSALVAGALFCFIPFPQF